MTRTVDEADMTHKTILETVHLEDVLLCRAGRCVTHWTLTPWVFALVDFGIGIAKLDRDVSLKLILEPDRVDAGEGFHHSGLPVCHMTDCANVDRCLP